MSRRLPRAALPAAVIALSLALSPARAADVTPEQARDVARQLHGWVASLLGGTAALPADAFSITPAGELYRLRIPVPGATLRMQDDSGAPTDALYSAGLRALGGTRWAIEDLRMPAVITLADQAATDWAGRLRDLAPGNTPAPTQGTPAPTSAPPPAPGMEIRIRTQAASGIYDTSLQTESRLQVTTQGLQIRSNGFGLAAQRSEATLDRFTGLLQLRPRPAGGTDTLSEWTMEGYSGVNHDPSTGELKFSIRRAHLRGDISALMTAQVTTILQTAFQMGMEAVAAPATAPAKPDTTAEAKPGAARPGTAQPGAARPGSIRPGSAQPGSNPQATPANPPADASQARLKTILAALKGVISGMSMEQSIEGLQLEVMGMSGGAERILFALGGGVPDGKFAAHLELAVNGLKVASLPPEYAALLPLAMSVRPTLNNIDIAALSALADEAAAPAADMNIVQMKLAGLLTNPDIRVGIERLSIDFGTTKLTASGSLTPVQPLSAKGNAEIIMTGYDALLARVQKLPDVMQFLPALALARGLAHVEGNKLIWRLAMTEDQKITINGVDLRKLGGG